MGRPTGPFPYPSVRCRRDVPEPVQGAAHGLLAHHGEQLARTAGQHGAGEVTVLDGPVLASAARELLTVVREQAVSRTLHRFGHVPPATD